MSGSSRTISGVPASELNANGPRAMAPSASRDVANLSAGAMRWSLLLLMLTGCLTADSPICGDKVCAPTARCDEPTSTCIPAGCGNGVVDNNERCDGDALGGAVDCTSLGYYDHHPLACTIDCQLDTSTCEESCGDHAVNGPELCDGAPPDGQSCLDYGYGAGRISCADACTPTFDSCTTVGLKLEASFSHVLHAIDGRAADDAFAVGGSGEIVHFDGHAWSPVGTLSSTSFASLWVDKSPGGRVVIAVGDDGTDHAAIARYDGQTWTEIHLAGVDAMSGVWGVGPNDVWAVGGNTTGAAIHFDGTSWSSTAVAVGSQPLIAVTGDPATGRLVAVGKARTTATFNGAMWTATQGACSTCTSSNYSLQAIIRLDGPTEYIAVGSSPPTEPAVAQRSTDGGLTWEPLPQTRKQTTLVSVSGVRGDVYISGTTGTLLRYDGKAFHTITTGSIGMISGVWRAAADEVVTIGNGEIRALDAAAWSDAGPIASDEVRLQGVASFGDETIAVGTLGTLLHTIDGVTWTPTDPGVVPADTNLTGAWFASSGEAYLSDAKPGVFYRSFNGAFTLFNPPPPSYPFDTITTAIFGTSPTNLYATGHNAKIFHGTTTTTAWAQESVPGTTEDLNGIWGSGPGDLYAVGNHGVLAHSTDGATWSPIAIAGLMPNLTGVWGSGPDDVFVVGAKGTILHFDGDAWRLQHTSNDDLIGVFGIAIPDPSHPGENLRATDVFAFGIGAMFHYDGVSWSPMSLPLLFGVVSATALAANDRNDVIFVGTRGNTATLSRPTAASETRCADGWDNDRNGLVDCADPNCATSDECTLSGGACRIEGVLACDSTLSSTTFSGIARLDTLPMVSELTDGPEAVYRFDATASGTVTLSLESQQPLDLLVTATYPGTAACDLQSPLAANSGAETISFSAVAGDSYAIIVDEPTGAAGAFTLTTTCQ